MAQAGGLKAAAKRTAFGELSNVANVSRPSKDDSVIISKTNVIVSEKAVAVLPQEKRPTALLRPAQRPLSVSGLKSLLHNVPGIHSQASVKQAPIEPQQSGQPVVQQPNTRKLATKKSKAVFKDAVISHTDLPQAESEISKAAPLPPVHRELLPSRQSRTEKLPGDSKPTSQATESTTADPSRPVNTTEEPAMVVPSSEEAAPLRSDGIYIDNHGDIQQYDFSEENEGRDDQVPEPAVDNAQPASVIDPHLVEKVDQYLKEHEDERQADAAPNSKLPPVSEPEEYWDEEDGNYEEEGYVTARSFKSRGENTTNGVTTVVFPKVNQKIKKELAAAKELIESMKTAEDYDDETWDTSMVAEYGEEIFGYMRDLEVDSLHLMCFRRLTRRTDQDAA